MVNFRSLCEITVKRMNLVLGADPNGLGCRAAKHLNLPCKFHGGGLVVVLAGYGESLSRPDSHSMQKKQQLGIALLQADDAKVAAGGRFGKANLAPFAAACRIFRQ